MSPVLCVLSAPSLVLRFFVGVHEGLPSLPSLFDFVDQPVDICIPCEAETLQEQSSECAGMIQRVDFDSIQLPTVSISLCG